MSWRGTRDPCKMTPKQRDYYFSRRTPSSLKHPWLQDTRSYAELHREERETEAASSRPCPMSGF